MTAVLLPDPQCSLFYALSLFNLMIMIIAWIASIGRVTLTRSYPFTSSLLSHASVVSSTLAQLCHRAMLRPDKAKKTFHTAYAALGVGTSMHPLDPAYPPAYQIQCKTKKSNLSLNQSDNK